MRTYTCLLTDRRYSVPTLSFVQADDPDRARELARRELSANPNHRGFELYEGERLVCAEQGNPDPTRGGYGS